MTFETYLFDLDGTLIDSFPMIVRSMRHTLEAVLGSAPSDAVLRGRIGKPLVAQMREHAEKHPTKPEITDALVDQLVRTYLEHNISIQTPDNLKAYPGVRELLEGLTTRGVRLGLVTSKSRDSTRVGLEVTGLASFFEVVVVAEDVTRHKPHPDPVLLGLARLGVEPEGAVYVGDAPLDMRAGRAAGVKTGAALWGPFGLEKLAPTAPDLLLNDPRELL